MAQASRPQADSPAYLAERVNQVYANEPAGLIGTALGAVVFAAVQAPVCGAALSWSWCAVLLIVTAARLWARQGHARSRGAPEEARRRAAVFRSGVFLSGAAWGSTALLFFPDASPAHQMFTAFMIAGMSSGAAAAYSALEGAFAAYAVPAIAPLFAVAALSGGALHRPMAIMILAWCLFMLLVSRSIRRSAHRAIRLGFENRGLLETLSRTMQETLSLNTALQRHRDELEATVARRTGELSRANRELREALETRTRMEEERRKLEEQLLLARKMESLGTLAGGVAHDFNNLLMGIGGQISLLLAGREGDEGPEAARLRAVERQVREGAELTRQLLGLAMGGKYEVKPLDVNDLVRKVAALFARTHKEIRVGTRLEEGLPVVEADRGQLEQALLNICINAWQAMPGGGTLDLSTRRERVDPAKASPFGAEPGDYAVISAADTGTGMDRSVLARIFDPFFTTRGPGERGGRPGAGLGLSSAYGIVRNHGGFIEVDSERGRGSIFSIYLPASAVPTGPADRGQGGAAAEPDARRTVLLVEDEPVVSEVAALMLQRLGFKALRAMGGEEALDLYRGRMGRGNGPAVDLVMLDMIMPGMGGDETFRRLKQMDASVKVLLSSGYSVEGRARELLKEEGCLGFLPKPYNLAELRAKLEEILGPGAVAPVAAPEGA